MEKNQTVSLVMSVIGRKLLMKGIFFLSMCSKEFANYGIDSRDSWLIAEFHNSFSTTYDKS